MGFLSELDRVWSNIERKNIKNVKLDKGKKLLGLRSSAALVLYCYIESISGDPLSKTVLGFKPHIPKEVSNTVLLFCGESSLAQRLWHRGPPSPLTTTVVTWDGRFTRHYISLHIKRSSVTAAEQRRSRKGPLRRDWAAQLRHPCGHGDAGTAGARKSLKKVPSGTNGNTLGILQQEVKFWVFTQTARALSEQTGPPSKSFMSTYIHTASAFQMSRH